MEFPRKELTEKYYALRKQYADPYVPDFDVAGGTVRYMKFNDNWKGLNPFARFLLPRLTHAKNTFPNPRATKIPANANPDEYVTVRYDASGTLRTTELGFYNNSCHAVVYVSDQLTISYTLYFGPDGTRTYRMTGFEWHEYDDSGRLLSWEEFRCPTESPDAFAIDCEYYEYENGVLSRARYFRNFENNPDPMAGSLILRMMPDRLYNPDRFEYEFRRVPDGMDFTCRNYFRVSQTITYEEHISEKTITHLTDNGFIFL